MGLPALARAAPALAPLHPRQPGLPDAAAAPARLRQTAAVSLSYSIATPSYAGDIERCRLLCASIDRFVTGHANHYLLVEDRDVPLFRDLEGPRRRVIAESALLPSWLKSLPDPLSLGRRRV